MGQVPELKLMMMMMVSLACSNFRYRTTLSIGAGTIFRLGEQKLVKKQSRQSNSKYNFMQYVFFDKVAYTMYNGASGKPQEPGSFREFLCEK